MLALFLGSITIEIGELEMGTRFHQDELVFTLNPKAWLGGSGGQWSDSSSPHPGYLSLTFVYLINSRTHRQTLFPKPFSFYVKWRLGAALPLIHWKMWRGELSVPMKLLLLVRSWFQEPLALPDILRYAPSIPGCMHVRNKWGFPQFLIWVSPQGLVCIEEGAAG